MKRRTFLRTTLAAVALSVSAVSHSFCAAVADICSKVRPCRRAILPPIPRWNKATDDIDSADFLRRSVDYERSLLPPDAAFPRVGQIWESVRDCEVYFRLWSAVGGSNAWLPQAVAPPIKLFQAPFTTFTCGSVRLQQGERVRIEALDDANRPLQVTFVPLRYDELHPILVPENQRRTSSRYVLTLRTAYTVCCSRDATGFFHELFRLVDGT